MYRILNPKGHRIDTWAVLSAKALCLTLMLKFTVYDEVNVTLAVQPHFFVFMLGYLSKPHLAEQCLQIINPFLIWSGVFHKLESVGAIGLIASETAMSEVSCVFFCSFRIALSSGTGESQTNPQMLNQCKHHFVNSG